LLTLFPTNEILETTCLKLQIYVGELLSEDAEHAADLDNRGSTQDNVVRPREGVHNILAILHEAVAENSRIQEGRGLRALKPQAEAFD
jgi:hypothetical protein